MKWILWIFVALAGILFLITIIGYLSSEGKHTVARQARFTSLRSHLEDNHGHRFDAGLAARIEKRQTPCGSK